MRTIPMQPEHMTGMSPSDAFERLCLEVIQLEAVANAANVAMDECAPPIEARRSFDRAHALISNTAEKASAAVALIGELKASLETHGAATR